MWKRWNSARETISNTATQENVDRVRAYWPWVGEGDRQSWVRIHDSEHLLILQRHDGIVEIWWKDG